MNCTLVDMANGRQRRQHRVWLTEFLAFPCSSFPMDAVTAALSQRLSVDAFIELHCEFRLPDGNLPVRFAARQFVLLAEYTRRARSSRDLRLAQAPASRPCKHHESRSPGSLCSSSLPNDDSEVPEVSPEERELECELRC